MVNVYNWMNKQLAEIGAHLDDLYYCPHHPEGKLSQYKRACDCRKPNPKMVNDACQKHHIDKSNSYFVGDTEGDMNCAQNAGVTGIRYQSGSLLELVKSSIE